ncbi:MAG: hypothetical protein ACKKL6_00600 [Candidatus Komeilibacteria bacterium]
MNKEEFDFKKQGVAIVTISSCLDILNLIVEGSFRKGTPYFLESLFVRLRHLSYFFSSKKSPLIKYRDKFSQQELDIIDKIINARGAAAHPESESHWLNGYIMISGAMNFNNGDVGVQYGSNIIFLKKEIIPVYKKFREIFSQAPELSDSINRLSWEMDDKKFEKLEKEITDLLKEPTKLFKDRLDYT